MTDDNQQLELWDAASRLRERLLVCEGALRPRGGVEYAQHIEFAGRARLLGTCLDAVLRLATDHHYPAAFALLRTALEHEVFDRLLFLASRHVQVIEAVPDEVWNRWQAQPPKFLLEWSRLPNDRVRAVWRGVRVVDDKGEVSHFLSIYYKWWKDFDPFVAPWRNAGKLASGYPESPTARAAYARTQREMWRDVLAWKNLKGEPPSERACDRNRCCAARRSLSLSQRIYASVDGRFCQSPVWPESVRRMADQDHYAEELVLLYVCAIAIDELGDFERMSTNEPQVDLADWDSVRSELSTAEARIAHFWPPGRPPYSYDRAKEANQRVFDVAAQHDAGVALTHPPTPPPDTIPDAEIRYYPDPFHRLVQLHAGFAEATTGVWWASPWPRPDARYR